MHIGNVVRDNVHRARSVERNHGDDMMDCFGLHLHQVTGHATAFQLEESSGVAVTDVLIHFWVIDWNGA